ncbi:hypothetical protein [Paenibacillus sp. sgz500992]|uniref:hypothetical protein n=1 Tax=Paenibacillus sp. sgz500992 TaxID=3242476 RepID=UPI0036D3874B
MSSRVHYFSFYLSEEMEKGRQAIPASFAKVEYVKEALIRSGAQLNLVSTALVKSGMGFLGKTVIEKNEKEKQIYLPTFRYPGKFINKLTVLFMWLQIIIYVLLNVKKNETVLVYHSLLYIEPFKLLRKLKKFKLILEFNDLYHAVNKKALRFKEKEIRFIKEADEYLFMNSIAEEKFNNGKPYVLSFGNYNQPKRLNQQFSDEKTHVVYAGIIESSRRAAILGAQSALYLDANYKIHILGFGEDHEIDEFEGIVKDINIEKGYEAVIFHGRLRGQDFSDFLHSCHIGLSSHAYSEEEMDSANYTFPSKIPTYISHGLYVVSPNIPCVVQSPFSEFTIFYEKHKPEDIAKAIKEASLKLSEKNSLIRAPADLIQELDRRFCEEIKKILAI